MNGFENYVTESEGGGLAGGVEGRSGSTGGKEGGGLQRDYSDADSI